MYKEIAKFQRSGGKWRTVDIIVAKNSGLRFEFDQWLAVRTEMTGAQWHKALHQKMTHAYRVFGRVETRLGWIDVLPRCRGSGQQETSLTI